MQFIFWNTEMVINRKPAIVVGGALLAMLGVIAFVTLFLHGPSTSIEADPRQTPPVVRLATAVPVTGSEQSFTGFIGARVESNLGFRVPGKIVERLVDVGQQVKAGQPLLRIDDTDLRLMLTARRNTVVAAHAVLVQARADEQRYADLVKNGLAAAPQRYEQAKAAFDTATAQLAAAEAEAKVAENEATYSVLVADADGTVVDTLSEPGQVVAAGQPVVRLAHAGPREAVVALPETLRPAIGSVAEASLYGGNRRGSTAHLRQLSDAADPQTRTYEARYVLEGEIAAAPLGATVTIRVASQISLPGVQVPLGALFDDGKKTGVWVLDRTTSTVHFQAVELIQVTSETAMISGLNSGEPIVSLGAHLLHDGARVRTVPLGMN
ncbi:RND family efflux transporter MFP subunit [Rheinheimera pacifica]|uniref:efflux RND transporter periplasmic adaptor subunit n=1 Tax=Rheinheimera pacifica TaxID=173990 RepID=UPI002168D22A|nr:efflux RND transporter periplasmic adaptor subunit [Rheinheimera pacifica]MCS4306294.1 RND family efflux transporter MFP subunit [Rheinheimera pacifica]